MSLGFSDQMPDELIRKKHLPGRYRNPLREVWSTTLLTTSTPAKWWLEVEDYFPFRMVCVETLNKLGFWCFFSGVIWKRFWFNASFGDLWQGQVAQSLALLLYCSTNHLKAHHRAIMLQFCGWKCFPNLMQHKDGPGICRYFVTCAIHIHSSTETIRNSDNKFTQLSETCICMHLPLHILQAQTKVFLSHLQICLKFLGCKLQAETLLLHRVQHKVHLLKGHRTTNWACPCSDLTMISTLRERNGDRHVVPICMIPCLWWVELREPSIKFGRNHGRTFYLGLPTLSECWSPRRLASVVRWMCNSWTMLRSTKNQPQTSLTVR